MICGNFLLPGQVSLVLELVNHHSSIGLNHDGVSVSVFLSLLPRVDFHSSL
jgi:hypothetical protein